MFRWLRPKGNRPEDSEAYKAGEAVGHDIASVILNYKQQRWNPVHDRYLGILRDNLRNAISDPGTPPITLASAHYAIFKENVENLPAEMYNEMKESLGQVFDLAARLGTLDELHGVVQNMCNEFSASLLVDGQKTVTEYATVLADADDAWRAAHPVEAIRFPT